MVERLDEDGAMGRNNYGRFSIKDAGGKTWKRHRETEDEVKEAELERKRVAMVGCCLVGQEGQSEETGPAALLASWSGVEPEGWLKVECVLDSGASESVCPASMAPQWPTRESAGSRMGLHYTSASGGRMPNQGEQHIPIALDNGTCSWAVFQIAEVSRPLIGVGRVCEMGNRVVFGASGGVICNLATGKETRFQRKDGIYIFTIWIPLPNLAQGFTGQP